MIFVVLGIVILVLSFGIALYSLIREQKNHGVKPELDEGEIELKPQDIREEFVPPNEPAHILDKQPPRVNVPVSPAPQSTAREPFPWEVNVNESPIRSQTEEKLWQNPPTSNAGVITELTIGQTPQNVPLEPVKTTSAQPVEEPQVGQEGGEKKLIGEVSMSDIAKGGDQ